MNRNLLMIIGGVLVPLVMAVVFGYWAWVSRSSFLESIPFISDLDDFDLTLVTLFISGFFAGIFVAGIAVASSTRQDIRRQRERQELREEVRKELEMETQKKAEV